MTSTIFFSSGKCYICTLKKNNNNNPSSLMRGVKICENQSSISIHDLISFPERPRPQRPPPNPTASGRRHRPSRLSQRIVAPAGASLDLAAADRPVGRAIQAVMLKEEERVEDHREETQAELGGVPEDQVPLVCTQERISSGRCRCPSQKAPYRCCRNPTSSARC